MVWNQLSQVVGIVPRMVDMAVTWGFAVTLQFPKTGSEELE